MTFFLEYIGFMLVFQKTFPLLHSQLQQVDKVYFVNRIDIYLFLLIDSKFQLPQLAPCGLDGLINQITTGFTNHFLIGLSFFLIIYALFLSLLNYDFINNLLVYYFKIGNVSCLVMSDSSAPWTVLLPKLLTLSILQS